MSSRSENEILLEKECDRLKAEIDRHVRIYELALKEQAEELETARAAMLAIQEAFDAQPWATDEPVRVQLDRMTTDLTRVTAERDEIRSGAEHESRAIASFAAENAALRARVVELVAALRDMRDACKGEPAMNHQKYDALGIRVNNLLARAESATPKEVKP